MLAHNLIMFWEKKWGSFKEVSKGVILLCPIAKHFTLIEQYQFFWHHMYWVNLRPAIWYYILREQRRFLAVLELMRRCGPGRRHTKSSLNCYRISSSWNCPKLVAMDVKWFRQAFHIGVYLEIVILKLYFWNMIMYSFTEYKTKQWWIYSSVFHLS